MADKSELKQETPESTKLQQKSFDISKLKFRLKVICITTREASQSPKSNKPEALKDGEKDTKPETTPPRSQSKLQPNQKHVVDLEFDAENAAIFRSATTLAQVRTRIDQAFPKASSYLFCNEAFVPLPDGADLNRYFASLMQPPELDNTECTVFVAAPSQTMNRVQLMLDKIAFYLKLIRLVAGANQQQIEGSVHSSIFKGKDVAGIPLSNLRQLAKSMSAGAAQDTFCLQDGTPIQDSITLRQYLHMTSLVVDQRDDIPSIPLYYKKTSEPAVQPHSKLKWGAADPNVLANLAKPNLSFTDTSAQELKRDKAGFSVTDSIDIKQHAAHNATPQIHTSKLSENEWDLILKNSNALYGWSFDLRANLIKRAPRAAFRLRKGLNLEKSTARTLGQQTNSNEVALMPLQHQAAFPKRNAGSKERDKPQSAPQMADLREYIPVKPAGIPNFAVNDQSKIDIASTQHDFQQSMAENHFTASSFELGASGTVEGVTIGASGGVATSDSTGKASAIKKSSKTLIATYRLPRATVYLKAEDLEPTEDLKAVIEQIREYKNINDLRKLHALYGHVFSNEILIGGCLQSSKVIEGKEQSEESFERSKMKVDVGVSVSIPGGPGGNVKMSHETQDQNEQGQKIIDVTEKLAFTATGGNTILAANPPAWCESVTDFNYWRVIEQSQPILLAEMIAGIPSFEDVHMWFFQAVPKLSEYIVVPSSRTLDVRFKLSVDAGISRALASDKAKEQADEENLAAQKSPNSEQSVYLGHDTLRPPRAVRTFITTFQSEKTIIGDMKAEKGNLVCDLTKYTYQNTTTVADSLFFPSSTQAPVLMKPKLEDSDNLLAHRHSVWRFEVPYGYSLGHKSIVSIKSLADSATSNPPTLTVYRNAQGLFLPTMTASPDPCYWRVLKADPDASTDRIKDGETIRLCWRFSDQVSGWRDYQDDFYGRRRFNKPDDIEPDALYLKAPYPRFESLTSGDDMQLVMSTAKTRSPILQTVQVLDKAQKGGVADVNYNLFDLSFRLDHVGNGGSGEILDYMNSKWEERTVEKESRLVRIEQGKQEQGIEDVAGALGQKIGETVLGAVDRTVNQMLDDSGWEIAKKIAVGYAKLNPIIALGSMFF